jgi:hypothetical protein
LQFSVPAGARLLVELEPLKPPPAPAAVTTPQKQQPPPVTAAAVMPSVPPAVQGRDAKAAQPVAAGSEEAGAGAGMAAGDKKDGGWIIPIAGVLGTVPIVLLALTALRRGLGIGGRSAGGGAGDPESGGRPAVMSSASFGANGVRRW